MTSNLFDPRGNPLGQVPGNGNKLDAKFNDIYKKLDVLKATQVTILGKIGECMKVDNTIIDRVNAHTPVVNNAAKVITDLDKRLKVIEAQLGIVPEPLYVEVKAVNPEEGNDAEAEKEGDTPKIPTD
jgi:hypothetical protein